MRNVNRRKALTGIAASFAMLALPVLHPTKVQASSGDPINIVVPYGAGGSTDTYARVLAESMSEELGRQVLIENKPGANGIIASTYVAKSKPDGNTLLMGLTGQISLNPMLRPKLPYAADSFEPISLLFSGPLTITVPTSLGVSNLDELIKNLKESGSPARYGTLGVGSVTDLFGRMLAEDFGVEGVGISYKGLPPSIIDLIAGQAELSFSAPNNLMEYEKSGDLKILAVTTKTRNSIYPEIPTVLELGHPNLLASYWAGLFAPHGTSPEAVNEIAQAAIKAAKSEKFAELLRNQGTTLEAGGPKELSAQIEEDLRIWEPVIRKNNIILD